MGACGADGADEADEADEADVEVMVRGVSKALSTITDADQQLMTEAEFVAFSEVVREAYEG